MKQAGEHINELGFDRKERHGLRIKRRGTQEAQLYTERGQQAARINEQMLEQMYLVEEAEEMLRGGNAYSLSAGREPER